MLTNITHRLQDYFNIDEETFANIETHDTEYHRFMHFMCYVVCGIFIALGGEIIVA